MAAFDSTLFQCGFACGSVTYMDRYPGDEPHARIVIPVTIAESYHTQMIVDTGAPWCILDPEVADAYGLTVGGYVLSRRLIIRGHAYRGMIVNIPLAIQASNGTALIAEPPFFIPILDPGEEWTHPNFLGLDGFLSHIRFAVDTRENAFYFGHVQ